MARSAPVHASTGVHARLAAFVLERFPFALAAVQRAVEVTSRDRLDLPADKLRTEIQRHLRNADVAELPETTPGVTAEERWNGAVTELLDAVDGFLARESIAASLSADEKLEMMR